MSKKTYLSIDMGNKKIKFVHGGIEKDKILINEYFIEDTPPNTIEDGKIINLDKLIEIIKDVVKKNKIKEKNLILDITGTGIITRDVQLPKSTDEEIEKILSFEAQQYFPVELQNYNLDFKVQEEFENQEGILNRVLLVAVPLNQLDEYMKIHKMLGMEIAAIDITANSINKILYGDGNLFSEENNKLPTDFSVLDIGAKTTGVYIFSEGKLKFNRILLNGSNDIDQMISSSLNTDIEQAEEIKIEKGNIENDDDLGLEKESFSQINGFIKSVVNNIMNDISRLYEFYNSKNSINKQGKIFICGGGSKLRGIDIYLSNYFSVEVEHLYPSLGNIVYSGKNEAEKFSQDFPFLVNAIGSLVRNK